MSEKTREERQEAVFDGILTSNDLLGWSVPIDDGLRAALNVFHDLDKGFGAVQDAGLGRHDARLAAVLNYPAFALSHFFALYGLAKACDSDADPYDRVSGLVSAAEAFLGGAAAAAAEVSATGAVVGGAAATLGMASIVLGGEGILLAVGSILAKPYVDAAEHNAGVGAALGARLGFNAGIGGVTPGWVRANLFEPFRPIAASGHMEQLYRVAVVNAIVGEYVRAISLPLQARAAYTTCLKLAYEYQTGNDASGDLHWSALVTRASDAAHSYCAEVAEAVQADVAALEAEADAAAAEFDMEADAADVVAATTPDAAVEEFDVIAGVPTIDFAGDVITVPLPEGSVTAPSPTFDLETDAAATALLNSPELDVGAGPASDNGGPLDAATTDNGAATDGPATTDNGAATDEPATTDNGAATDGPATTDNGAATDEPATTDNGAATDGPATTDNGAATDEPATTDNGAATDEPATTDNGAATDEPATTDNGAATDEPATTDNGAATDEPATTEDFDREPPPPEAPEQPVVEEVPR